MNSDLPAVRYEVGDAVAWMTINRPDAHNALNRRVRDGLFEGFERFDADGDASVLVLTGAGDNAFCAGGDLNEMADSRLGVPPPDFLPNLGRNVELTKPTIAAVNGIAYAGGFLLAQMCDLCVAAEHARFGVTEAKVGRGAPWAVPLPWMIPPRVAMELLLTGEPISARRAHDVGLVNAVVPSAELSATAQALARRIAQNAPLSVLAAKRMMRALGPTDEQHVAADGIWESVYLSQDAQEGPQAFREKRSPAWRGL